MKYHKSNWLLIYPILKFIDSYHKIKDFYYYSPREISRKPETVITWKIVAINRNNDTNCSFIRRVSRNGFN